MDKVTSSEITVAVMTDVDLTVVPDAHSPSVSLASDIELAYVCRFYFLPTDALDLSVSSLAEI